MNTEKNSLKKQDASSASHINEATRNSKSQNFITMKTHYLSPEMKAILFSIVGIPKFQLFCEKYLIGKAGKGFRSTINYVNGLTDALKLLHIDDTIFSKIKDVTYLKKLQAQLEENLKYSTDKHTAYGLSCAFAKYISFVEWVVTPPAPQTYAIAA
ncbi:MAG: hypothetical protein ACLQQ4_12645 [Bacteroidia bacterium]